jgi:hypothetical protein
MTGYGRIVDHTIQEHDDEGEAEARQWVADYVSALSRPT